VLELGKAGSAGTAKGTAPVLRDGAVVATLRASNWKEAATAAIADREWVFAKHKGELSARWSAEPQGPVRLRARQASLWKGTWSLALDGTAVDMQNASMWRGTHRYLVSDRQVAESGNTGGWAPRPTLTADPSMPLEHQVFLLWMELVISRRNTAAISGATTAAVIGGTS
jgi:hypothetical protein